ncbi:hypothetical protein M422DRAFT_28022 [Sphaerobolus stellatus SS14]|nr:hypothetical protein M422DRAFT_28022 [Sphaerobolus stellatus SS14]
MEMLLSLPERLKNIRETKLSSLRPIGEFVDHNRISRPADLNTAVSRISYNTRYFSGNYLLIIVSLAVYAVITNPVLLIALALLIGGFILINRWAPEPLQVGDRTITQKHLYTALFVIGLPLLWWASPVATFFWLVFSSSFIILFHAALLEPGVESEYASVEGGV